MPTGSLRLSTAGSYFRSALALPGRGLRTVRPATLNSQPHQVIDPASGFDAPFTNAGAWELIAAKLESGHDVEAVALRKPAGATGYAMKIEIDPAAPLLYVKVEPRAGRILGRSFHYSRHE